MTRGRVSAVLAIALCCFSQRGDSAEKRVRFIWPPHQLTYDSQVRLTVRVDPQEENRYLDVSAVDGGGQNVRESEIELPGEKAPIIHTIEWYSLSTDTVLFKAVLLNVERKAVAYDSSTVTVWGPGGP